MTSALKIIGKRRYQRHVYNYNVLAGNRGKY